MKPNLFWFAPSELSQDAFLCWLLSWADKKHREDNPNMHKLGVAFLNSIYGKAGTAIPADYNSIDIRKQDGGIDILCIVNGDTAIIIEDKTGTEQHSDQLPRYKTYVSGLPGRYNSIIPVYLQTGDQSDYGEVNKHGYLIYERRDLLLVLESPAGIAGQETSDILSDYTRNLRRIEDAVQSYKLLSPKEWSWDAWRGFYSALQEHLKAGNWKYVANPSEGFLGFWWHFLGDEQCEQYLQIEQDKFCFKIYVKENDKRRELREFWHKSIIKECSLHGIKARRPDRFGNGYTMTVAIMDQEFIIIGDDQRIDMKKTVELLKSAETVLDSIKAQQALGADLASSAAQA